MSTITPVYTTSATSTGGGRDGQVVSDLFDLQARPPKELGGSGEGVNPEVLFAGAWAACFNGALQLMMKNAGLNPADFGPEVTAEVTLGKDEADGGFGLFGEVTVKFATNPENAAELVAQAHEFCPYSKALRGGGSWTAKLG